MLVGCTYRGLECKDSRFWYPTLSTGYGMCYTFNFAHNDLDEFAPRSASLTGIDNGFAMEVFLDQSYYMLNNLAKKAGARITVHDPELPPLTDEYGMDLQPNTASSIAIQMNDIRRKAAPYVSNCTTNWTQTPYKDVDGMIYNLAVSYLLGQGSSMSANCCSCC